MTFFFWACQFTIDPYVKTFHINEYHLTHTKKNHTHTHTKNILLRKNVINIIKFVKHNNTVHTTGNPQLHVQEKRQKREMSYKGS